MLPAKAQVAAAGVLLCVASVAEAEDRRFSIPASTLGQAVVTLGLQSDLTIGISDSTLAGTRTHAVSGVMPVRTALDRLLAGTGGAYIFVDTRTVRIVRAETRKPVAPLRRVPPVDIETVAATEIVVTASKQGTALNRYPGTATVIDLDDPRTAGRAVQGTEAIIERLPILSSTSLGPGREKLFVRGVADSSFSGPSQATVGQYFGEVRLNYSAPDPDLGLYDIARIEVLEGPQGTLYGTGSLGGIIRIVPRTPDTGNVSASLSFGASATRHGGTGSDIAAMLNLPIVPDRLAVRAVAYRTSEPGYIEDIGRGMSQVNRSGVTGARIALGVRLGDAWTVDIGGVLQTIDQRDGQYALSDLPPLTRISRIAQPFDNHYGLAYATITKKWGMTELVSTTSYVDHRITTTYDASGPAGTVGPIQFDENVVTSLLSHETRITGRSDKSNWVIGLGIVRSVDRLRRHIGTPGNPSPILGVLNVATEAAFFGQYSFAVAADIRLTFGGRLTFAEARGEALDNAGLESAESQRGSLVALPMAGLSWQPDERLVFFVQAQRGHRAGGLSITESAAAGVPSVDRFEGDWITTVEAGLRFGRPQHSRLWGNLTASFARWVSIQSDLIDAVGFPFTANIGDGRILGLEGQVTWRASNELAFDLAAFFNKSKLDRPAPLYVAALDLELPNVAEIGARLGFRYRQTLGADFAVTLDGSARYVGKSNLGFGTLLGLDQGGYTELAVGGRLEYRQFGFSIDIRNIADVRGNRFAYGNPFTISLGNQITPLRPRSMRIGVDVRF